MHSRLVSLVPLFIPSPFLPRPISPETWRGYVKDVDTKLRNSLYVNLNRFMEKAERGAVPGISKAVLKRWDEAKKDRKLKWDYFKEWMQDPTCASIRVTERHVKESLKTEGVAFHWQGRWDINQHFHADTNPAGMKMADDVCRMARESIQHKDYPGEPNWMMHLVPKSHIITNIDRELHSQSVQVTGTITDAAAAQSLLNVVSESTIRDFGTPKVKAKAKGKGKPMLGGPPPVPVAEGGAPLPAEEIAPKKVINLASKANELSSKITNFEMNIIDLTARKIGD